MDEKTGQTVNDISENGLSATLGLNSSVNTDDPTWTTGKYGAGLSFDGGDYVARGTGPTIINTVSFWTYPTSTTNYFVDLNGSAYISAPSGTLSATGFTSPTIYVNGVVSSTLAANQWQYITVTTATNLNASALNFGKISTNYLAGKLDEVKLYNYARTSGQIVEDMNAGHPAPGSPVGSAVGYWKMDEGYGTTAYDSSPVANNGTFGASPRVPTWTNNGKFGKALSFDASTPANGDVVNLTDNTAYQVTTGLTLSAWVNPSTSTGQTEWIIARATGVSPWDDYNLTRLSNGSFKFQVRLASGLISASTATSFLSTNTWYHLVGTYDATTGNAYIYVNGVRKGSGTGTGNIQVSSTKLKIGCWSTSADACDSTTPFNGLIDEVKIYNSALTEDEIKLDYNRGSSMVLGSTSTTSAGVPDNSSTGEYCVPGSSDSCSAPVAEWKMDEKTGGYAYDTSGNGNNLTLAAGATWGLGKVGAAVKLDGSDDYIYGNLPTSYSEYTVEGWINWNGTQSSTYPTFAAFGTYSPGFYLEFGDNNYVSYYRSGISVLTFFPLSDITTNTWHYLSFTKSGSTISSYLDGKFKASITDTDTTDNTVIFSGDKTALPPNNTTQWGGFLDQVRIYNYARTPAQIAWDYNRGGPVGWWKMDECQGGTANDSSGNGNNGTITIGSLGSQSSLGTCAASAATAWYNGVTGKYNSSLNFDGTDDYVTRASTQYDFSKTFSIGAWIKTTTLASYKGVVPKFSNTGTAPYISFHGSGGNLRFECSDVGSNTRYLDWNGAISGSGLTDSQWHFVFFTYDQNNVKSYKDGVYQGMSTSWTYGCGNVSDTFYIGNFWAGTFSGQIDDVRIFNYALTANQVKTLFNSGSAVQFGPSTGSP